MLSVLTFTFLVSVLGATLRLQARQKNAVVFTHAGPNSTNFTKLCLPCAPGSHSTPKCGTLPNATANCSKGFCVKGGENCTLCKPGYNQPNPQGSGCIGCGAGTWTNQTGTILCQDCQAGYSCPGNANSYMTECPVGFYCPDKGLRAPWICPPGSYCPHKGLVKALLCPHGYYCVGGNSSMVICPANTECPTGSASPTPCSALFHSKEGMDSCTPTVGFWGLLAGICVVFFVLCVMLGKFVMQKLLHNRDESLSKEITNLIPPSTGPQYSGF